MRARCHSWPEVYIRWIELEQFIYSGLFGLVRGILECFAWA
jgi:hypothetical protein